MHIVAISDTHNRLKNMMHNIPDGNLLIHCGDLTGRGEIWEIENELDKLALLNPKFNDTILIAGNHDFGFERHAPLMEQLCKERDIIYLNDSGVDLNGVKVWGSPVSPHFYSWAFNRRRTEQEHFNFGGGYIKDHWDLIPQDTNILITHGPPMGILDDLVFPDGSLKGEQVGCEELKKKIETLPELRYHVFGHIHNWGGQQKTIGNVTYCNASICDERYIPSNPVTVVDYETK